MGVLQKHIQKAVYSCIPMYTYVTTWPQGPPESLKKALFGVSRWGPVCICWFTPRVPFASK